jgi:hypothetical protein
MGYPIDIYDMAELVIQREVQLTQTNTGLSGSSIFYLDNTGNMQSFPVINLTTHGPNISTITISNITTSNTVVISGVSIFPSGTILDVFNDAVYYSSDSTEASHSFSGIFSLAENASNSIRITISTGTSGRNVDVITQWLQPSSVETTIAYVEDFSITENRSQKQKGINLLDKYAKKYSIQTVTYEFNIGKLFYDTWFQEEVVGETYRIKWATNSDTSGVDQITYYLNGCQFNSLTWNESENDLTKENIRGVACRKIQG